MTKLKVCQDMSYLYTIFCWLVVRDCPDGSPGEPRKDKSAGQNLCHKNVVKCMLEWTVCGKVLTKVSKQSSKKIVISVDLGILKFKILILIKYLKRSPTKYMASHSFLNKLTILSPPVYCIYIASQVLLH